MNTLAELAFEYIWLLLFTDEREVDPDYAVKMQETLPDYFASMSVQEKAALSLVAKNTKDRLLAEPDEHGYTPRAIVTEEQKVFLDALESGELFEQWG